LKHPQKEEEERKKERKRSLIDCDKRGLGFAFKDSLWLVQHNVLFYYYLS
jgi:hypothetical protein